MKYKKIIIITDIETISFYNPTNLDVVINYADIYENLNKTDYLNNPPNEIVVNYEIQVKLREFKLDEKTDRCFLVIRNAKETIKSNILSLFNKNITVV
jgi:hypothetical protein